MAADSVSALSTPSFDRFGSLSAMLAGTAGLLYAISFVVIARVSPQLGGLLSALFLMLNGLCISSVMVALYSHLRASDAGAAMWAVMLGSLGAVGAMLHGGYDLANSINPPATPNMDLPNQIDPRGLLTFGVSGLALFVIARLMQGNRRFSAGLRYHTYLLAALLVIIYLGRLIVLDPANPVLLIPVLLAGFLVNPAWYLRLGLTLRRQS
jgi:hypothetical protein